MKMKKLLAGILAGAMVVGSVMSVSAASVSDVASSTWWTNFSSGIEIEDDSTTTITFTQTTDSDAEDVWDVAYLVVYTATEANSADALVSTASGYTEYAVLRSDNNADYSSNYYWDALSNCASISHTINNMYSSDTEWLAELKAGVATTATVTRSGANITIVLEAGSAKSTLTLAIASTDSQNVYIAIGNEYSTITNISYTVASDDSDDADDTEEEEAEETVEETVTTATTGEASTIVLFMVAMVAIAGTAFTMKKAR